VRIKNARKRRGEQKKSFFRGDHSRQGRIGNGRGKWLFEKSPSKKKVHRAEEGSKKKQKKRVKWVFPRREGRRGGEKGQKKKHSAGLAKGKKGYVSPKVNWERPINRGKVIRALESTQVFARTGWK